MNLILASTGSYPRIGDSPELQVLRRTIAAADRGERTPADLVKAEAEMTGRAIEEQIRAGLDLLTDGQIRWSDPISHLAGKLSGVQIKGLLRFFDTNFYFRQPLLTARPERSGPLVVDEFRSASNLLASDGKRHPVLLKPVLTGPYTLAKFSLAENSAMKSLDVRAEAYTKALASEIRALGEAGAEFIQVDEPAIIKYPQDWPVFSQALELLSQARKEPAAGATSAAKPVLLALYVYFRDCAPIYEKLAQLPVDVLGIDFTYNPKLIDRVTATGSPIPLGLGLVDGRNTKLEDAGTVARQIERLAPKIQGGVAYLGTSCGLEYLPRDRAYAKLELLGEIRAKVNGSSA